MISTELRELARLALPLSIVQVGYQLTGLVDSIFAGRIDERALAATGVGSSIFFAVSVLGIGVSLGLDPLAAQAFGAGKARRARELLWHGLVTAGILTIPLCLLVWLGAVYLEIFGVVPEIAETTRAYVYARLPSLPLLMVSVTLRSYLQAAHRARPVVWASVATNVVNAIGNGMLVFGDEGLARWDLPGLGIPPLGVVGLGIATVIATLAQAVALVLAVVWTSREGGDAETKSEERAAPPSLFRFDLAAVRQQFSVGLPIGLHLLTEVGVFSAVQVVMGNIGVLASASHQASIMLASLTFSACLGIGSATSVQVGRAVGKGAPDATRRLGLMGIALGGAFMSVASVVMWTVPEWLTRFVTPDEEVITAAASLLRVAGFFQIVDGVQAVAGGALRGAGVTRFTFVAHLVAHWVIGLPIGLLMTFYWGYGPEGLWWGLTCGLTCVSIALVGRFLRLTGDSIVPLEAQSR